MSSPIADGDRGPWALGGVVGVLWPLGEMAEDPTGALVRLAAYWITRGVGEWGRGGLGELRADERRGEDGGRTASRGGESCWDSEDPPAIAPWSA